MTERLLPVSGIQRQFWLAQELQRETTAYHIATLWCIRGGLKLESLQVAFEELCQRHEACVRPSKSAKTHFARSFIPTLPPSFAWSTVMWKWGGTMCSGSSSARST